MKKLTYIGLIAVGLMMSHCSNEAIEDDSGQPIGKGNTTLTAVTEGALSRTSVDADYHLLWSEGDAIGVNDGMDHPFTLASGAGTQSATFTGDMSAVPSTSVYAFYPHQSGSVTNTLSGTTLTMTLPDGYEYTAATNGPMTAHLVGDKLAFTQLCGLLKVSLTDIPATATRFVLTGTSPVAGTGTVDVSAASAALALPSGGNYVSTSVTVTLNDAARNNKYFYFPLPVGKNTLTVSLQDGNGKVYYSRTSNELEIKRAHVVEMPALEMPTCVTDAASLLSAINAAAEGETILCQNGEYSFADPLTIDKQITIAGASRDGVKWDLKTSILTVSKSVTFRNLSITSATTTHAIGVDVSDVTLTMENVQVGITVAGTGNTVEKWHSAIKLSTPGANLTMTDCAISIPQNYQVGVDVQGTAAAGKRGQVSLNHVQILTGTESTNTNKLFSRGISISASPANASDTCLVVKVKGCKIGGMYYSIRTEKACSKVRIDVEDSEFIAWAPLHVWGADTKFHIIRSILTGRNHMTGPTDNCADINIWGAGNSFYVKDGTFNVLSTTAPPQFAVGNYGNSTDFIFSGANTFKDNSAANYKMTHFLDIANTDKTPALDFPFHSISGTETITLQDNASASQLWKDGKVNGSGSSIADIPIVE